MGKTSSRMDATEAVEGYTLYPTLSSLIVLPANPGEILKALIPV